MSEPQKAASAHSFAKRQTLTAVLGLTTTEPDTDGVDPTAISAKQIADLECLIEEVHADLPKFLEFMGVPSLSEIVASDYARAVAALKRKGRSS